MSPHVRVTTPWHRAWARQLGAFQNGRIVAFALVDPSGRELGQVLLADRARLSIEPAVLLDDGLHLAAGAAASASLDLRGVRVLVAEDDAVIALCLRETLRDLGCAVLGPLSSVSETLALLATTHPDVALLDVHMADGAITPAACLLAERNVPMIVTTGDDEACRDPALRGAVFLRKPYSDVTLRHALRRVLAGRD